MRKIGITVFLMFCLCPYVGMAQESEVYIAVNKVLEIAPNYTKSVQKVDSLTVVYKEEINTAKSGIDSAYQIFVKENKVTSKETQEALKKRVSEVTFKKFTLLQEEYTQLEKRAKELEDLLALQYKTEVRSIELVVTDIINTYAEKNNIPVIHNLDALGNSLVYVDKKLIVTNKIIELVQNASQFTNK